MTSRLHGAASVFAQGLRTCAPALCAIVATAHAWAQEPPPEPPPPPSTPPPPVLQPAPATPAQPAPAPQPPPGASPPYYGQTPYPYPYPYPYPGQAPPPGYAYGPYPYYAPSPPPPPPPAPKGPPPAAQGFQMGIRMGVALPAGSASGSPGDSQSSRYSGMFDLLLELGGKVSTAVFVGGYLGMGAGTTGDDPGVESACTDHDSDVSNDVSCAASVYRLGVEAQYHFIPAGTVNPWLGLGLGYENARAAIRDEPSDREEVTSTDGWELILGGAVDFRLSRAFGLGPYFMGSLGRYTGTKTRINGRTKYDGGIDDSATHGWISAGLRFVIFP